MAIVLFDYLADYIPDTLDYVAVFQYGCIWFVRSYPLVYRGYVRNEYVQLLVLRKSHFGWGKRYSFGVGLADVDCELTVLGNLSYCKNKNDEGGRKPCLSVRNSKDGCND